jgi:hypothetical protein
MDGWIPLLQTHQLKPIKCKPVMNKGVYVNGNYNTMVQSEYSVITALYRRHCPCNCRCCGTEIPCGWTRQRDASWNPAAVDIHLSFAKCRRRTLPTTPAWRTTRSARPVKNSSCLVSVVIALFLCVVFVCSGLSLHDCQDMELYFFV